MEQQTLLKNVKTPPQNAEKRKQNTPNHNATEKIPIFVTN